jgi:hypothetical protein
MKTPKTCPRCGKVFSHRGNLNNHLRKQKLCKVLYVNAHPEDIIKDYDTCANQYQNIFKDSSLPQSEISPPSNKPKLTFKFKTKDGETNIKKLSNTHQYTQSNTTSDTTSNSITSNIQSYTQSNIEKNKYKNESSDIAPQTSSNDASNDIVSKLTEIISTLSKTINTSSITASGDNNILGGNSKQLNQHFNITVNTFGNEDLSHISHKDWHKIIKQNINAIPELTKKIYIDEKKNRNIYFTSPKDGYCRIYTDDGWKYKGAKTVLNEIIETNADRIYNYMESDPKKHHRDSYKKMEHVIDRMSDDSSFIVKQNMLDIKEILMNQQQYDYIDEN